MKRTHLTLKGYSLLSRHFLNKPEVELKTVCCINETAHNSIIPNALKIESNCKRVESWPSWILLTIKTTHKLDRAIATVRVFFSVLLLSSLSNVVFIFKSTLSYVFECQCQ